MSGNKEIYYDEIPSLVELWELIDEGERFTIVIETKEEMDERY